MSRNWSRFSRAVSEPVASSSRSASVLLPWSMCATMQKFRMLSAVGHARPGVPARALRLEVGVRPAQPLLHRNPRLPPEHPSRQRDVGPPHLRIVRRQLAVHDPARAAGDLDDLLRHRAQRHLAGVSDVDGAHVVRAQQAPDALHEIVDVAERAGLRPIAEQGHVLAADRLPEEVRNGPAVVDLHARAEGVEDAHDADVDAVVAVVGHRHRLGEALGLVVDAADADRVHVAPVGLGLRDSPPGRRRSPRCSRAGGARPSPWRGPAPCGCRANPP